MAKKVRFRRNFATIQEAVQLWEKLRPKTTSKEEKEELVERIVGMVGRPRGTKHGGQIKGRVGRMGWEGGGCGGKEDGVGRRVEWTKRKGRAGWECSGHGG